MGPRDASNPPFGDQSFTQHPLACSSHQDFDTKMGPPIPPPCHVIPPLELPPLSAPTRSGFPASFLRLGFALLPHAWAESRGDALVCPQVTPGY